jgi:hypothetical protein
MAHWKFAANSKVQHRDTERYYLVVTQAVIVGLNAPVYVYRDLGFKPLVLVMGKEEFEDGRFSFDSLVDLPPTQCVAQPVPPFPIAKPEAPRAEEQPKKRRRLPTKGWELPRKPVSTGLPVKTAQLELKEGLSAEIQVPEVAYYGKFKEAQNAEQGQALRRQRVSLGLTQGDVGAMIGCGRTYVSDMEKGMYPMSNPWVRSAAALYASRLSARKKS